MKSLKYSLATKGPTVEEEKNITFWHKSKLPKEWQKKINNTELTQKLLGYACAQKNLL